MKKLALFVFVLLTIFALAACNRQIDLDLDPPANVVIVDGVVSWAAVDEADSYIVFVNLTEYPVTSTSFDLKTLGLAAGTYQISVVAVKGEAQSLPSSVIPFVVEDGEPTSLATPQNVQLVGSVVSWDPVPNALGYVVIINSISYPTTSTSFNLGPLSLAPGTYSITVTATRNALLSNASSAVQYTVSAEVIDRDALLLGVLRTFDEDYDLGLIEDDFDFEWEFDSYQSALAIANAYTQSAIDMQMSEANALGLFQHMFDLPDRMIDANSIETLLVEFDMFDTFDVTPNNAAYMVIELLRVQLGFNIENSEYWLAYYEDQLLIYQAELADIYVDADFLVLLDFLEDYVPPSFSFELNEFLYGAYDYKKTEALDSTWIVYDAETQDEPWFYDNDYAEMLFYAYRAAYLAEDFDLLNAIKLDNWLALSPLREMLWAQQSVYWVQWDIDYETDQIESLSNMVNLVENQHTLLLNTLSMVIDYFVLLSDSLPLVAIEHIDELIETGVLTPEEIFILKDALVDMLIDTLPEATDMSMLFLSLLYVGEAFGEVVIADKALYADFLGLAGHASLDLWLSLISAVDLDFVNELLVLADDMMLSDTPLLSDYLESGGENIHIIDIDAEGFYDIYLVSDFDSYGELEDMDGNLLAYDDDSGQNYNFKITYYFSTPGQYVVVVTGYDYSSFNYGFYDLVVVLNESSGTPFDELGIDPVKVVEIAVLIGTFLDDFYVENEDKFLALEALFSTPAGEALLDLALEAFLAEMESSMSPGEYEMFVFIFDEVMADLDTFKEGLAVLADIGVTFIDLFLLTEGLFFINVFDLIAQLGTVEDPVAFGYELEALLTQFLAYNNILMGARDAESVEKVLRMLRIPLLASALVQGVMIDPEDFNVFFEGVVGSFASIISTVAELEVAALAFVESIAITDWLFDERWAGYAFDMDIVMIITYLVVIDAVITPEMEDLLLAAINTFFDDIFSHEVILLMTGRDLLDVSVFRDEVLMIFMEILAGSRAIAALDFDNLTENDILDIYGFLEGLGDYFGPEESGEYA